MTIQANQIKDLKSDIRTFLADNFLFGRIEALGEDESLLGNIIDSSGMIELVMFLQDRFAIVVDDEEIAVPENFDSVKNVVAYVARKLESKAEGRQSEVGGDRRS